MLLEERGGELRLWGQISANAGLFLHVAMRLLRDHGGKMKVWNNYLSQITKNLQSFRLQLAWAQWKTKCSIWLMTIIYRLSYWESKTGVTVWFCSNLGNLRHQEHLARVWCFANRWTKSGPQLLSAEKTILICKILVYKNSTNGYSLYVKCAGCPLAPLEHYFADRFFSFLSHPCISYQGQVGI